MTSACGSLQSANIGSVTGSATYDACDSDTISISANNVPSSTADKQYSVQREVCGDGEVIVKVLSVSGGLAGLELRASNATGAIKVGLRTALGTSVQRFVRTSTDGSQSSNNTTALGHQWLKLVRSGSSVSTYTSTNGSTWNFAATYTVSLPTCVQASLLVQSVNVNTTHTGVFKDLQFSSFTAPAGDTTTVSFDQDTISADAGDTINICLNITNPCICSPTGVEVQLAGSHTPHFVGYQPKNLTFEAEDTTLCFSLPVSNVQVNGYYQFVIDPYTDDTLNVLITGAGGDSGPVGVCGVEPAVFSLPDSLTGTSILAMPIKALDRFGNYYPAEKLGPSSICGCENGSGIFELTFQDVCLDRNYGFDDLTEGLARQEVVCRMFRDLSALLNPGNAIPNDLVNVEIRASNGEGVALMEDYQIGVASPIYYGGGFEDGIIAGLVEKAIQSKTDPNLGLAPFGFTSDSFHGYVRFNFEDFEFYLNNTDWVSNPPGNKDLYSVALHEALHLLGFASLIDAQDASRYSKLAEFGSLRCYSKYDTYLRTLNGANITSNGTNRYLKYPLTGNPYGIEVATTPSFFEVLCAADVEIHGPSCNNQALYRPNPWSDQGISHFNCDASGEGGCATHNGYVMNPCAADGEAQRHPHQQEVDMLCDLGYELSYEYGTEVYIGPANLLPFKWDYSTCSPGCNAVGVNDLLLFEDVESGGILDIETIAFIGNDINTVDYISNSFEILNVNYDVGTVVDNGDGFTFHASDVYAGTVIIRYLPQCSDGSPGQWAFIILRVTAPAIECSDDNSCELVCYGDFENLPPGAFSAFQDFRILLNGMTTDLITASTSIPVPPGTSVCDTEHLGGAVVPTPHSEVVPNSAFAGFETQTANYEGLQLKLREPLGATLFYELSFYVYSGCSNTLNFHFSTEPPCPIGDFVPIAPVLFSSASDVACDGYLYEAGYFTEQLFPDTDTDNDNIPEWVKYTIPFEADDAYRYLTIYQDIAPVYAYFDNISVRRLEPREVTVSAETLGSFCPGESSEILYTICSDEPLEDVELLATLGVPPLAFFEEGGDFVDGEITISELLPSGEQYCAQVTLNLLLAEGGLAEGIEIPVHLSLLNACTNSSLDDAVIVIAYQPDASFTYSETDCVFDFTSSDPALGLEHYWTFESATTLIFNYDANPTGITLPNGEYLITHQVSNACGIDVETETIIVEGCCFTSLTGTFSYTTEDCDEICFTALDEDAGDFMHIWTFGDGNGSSAVNPCYSYQEPGTYLVVHTILSDCGVPYATTEEVTVTGALPDVTISAAEDETNCELFHFTATGAADTYAWSFPDNTTDTGTSADFEFSGPGIYEVKLTATNECGQTTETILVVVTSCEPLVCCPVGGVELTGNLSLEDVIEAELLDENGTTEDICINGTLTIDVDNYVFSSNTITLTANSSILIQDMSTLSINLAILEGCDFLWENIQVEDGGILSVRSSTIRDALYGIEARNGANISVTTSTFENNYIGILVPELENNQTVVHSITDNDFLFTAQTLMPLNTVFGPIPIFPISFSGIEVNNVDFVVSGPLPAEPSDDPLNAAGTNRFKGLYYGIRAFNSNLIVQGAQFEDIVEIPGAGFTLTSAGIYFRGPGGSLFQTGYGDQQFADIPPGSQIATPSFINCTNGIEVIQGHAQISDNRMLGMDTGVRLREGINRDIQVRDNYIEATWEGITAEVNSPSINFVLEDNRIEIGTESIVGNAGIGIYEASVPNGNARVNNNEIDGRARNGIFVQKVSKWQILENLVTNRFANGEGINLLGSQNSTIKCNRIGGAAIDNGRIGLNVENSPELLIDCNDSYGFETGIRFTGTSTSTTLSGNTMTDNHIGLHLDLAIFNAQVHRGNIWTGSFGGNGARFDALNPGNIEAGRFLVDATDGAFLMPPNPVPGVGVWFFPEPGNTYICDTTENACISGITPDLAPDETDVLVASGGILHPVLRWMAEKDLYRKMQKDSGFGAGINLYSNFENSKANTPVGKFYALYQDIETAFAADSSQQVLYRAGQEDIWNLLDSMAAVTTALLTATGMDSSALGVIRDNLFTDIATKAVTQDSLYALILANRSLRADTLLAENAAISVQKLYESNEKAVADIFLSVIMKATGSFSSTQEKTLQAIASQCPWVGGDAVYAARSLYRLIKPKSVFDDDVLCGRDSIPQALQQEESLPEALAELKAQDSEITSKTLEVSLYPNPAKDGFTVSFNQPLPEDVLLILTDLYGRRKTIQALNAGTMNFYLNTAAIPSGLYGCSIQSNRQVIAFNKIVITH